MFCILEGSANMMLASPMPGRQFTSEPPMQLWGAAARNRDTGRQSARFPIYKRVCGSAGRCLLWLGWPLCCGSAGRWPRAAHVAARGQRPAEPSMSSLQLSGGKSEKSKALTHVVGDLGAYAERLEGDDPEKLRASTSSQAGAVAIAPRDASRRAHRPRKGDAKRARAPLPLSELYLFPSRHLS
jgi:hypothetical protein